MTSITRRHLLGGAVAGAASAGGLIPARAAGTKLKLALPWIPHGGYAFLFAARQLGYWSKRGLDVQVDRGFGSGETCKRVALGQYDYGLADFGTMVKMVGDGLPLVCIGMVNHVSQLGILSLKESNINAPKDLEGKTMATTTGSADFALWPGFVAATGISSEKVKVNFVGPELRLRLLTEKKVDAIGSVYGSDAPIFMARDIPTNLMLHAKYGLEMYSNAIITHRDRLKNVDECQAMVDGAMEGLKYSFLDPDGATDTHLASVKEYEDASTDRKFVKYGVLINSAVSMAPVIERQGLGMMEETLVAGTQDKIATYLGLKTKSDPSSLFTNRFAGKIKLTPEEWSRVKEGVEALRADLISHAGSR